MNELIIGKIEIGGIEIGGNVDIYVAGNFDLAGACGSINRDEALKIMEHLRSVFDVKIHLAMTTGHIFQ